MTEQRPVFAENLDPYDGKWVAMRQGKVVAHADDEQSLRVHPLIAPDDLVFPVGHPVTGFYMLNV
jgi:Family of unknown function (DUF5678)